MAATPLFSNSEFILLTFFENQKFLSEGVMTKLFLISVCIVAFYLAAKLLSKIIRDVSVRKALGDVRVIYVNRLVNIGMVFCCLVVICLLVGLGYSEVSVFLSSIFAVVGIGLFAQWSILSNITASMIIFFGFPYRVNDRIRILDKDDDMTGIIEEISMFHVILRRDDGNLITYPNTLILQKAVLKLEHPERLAERDAGEDMPMEISHVE